MSRSNTGGTAAIIAPAPKPATAERVLGRWDSAWYLDIASRGYPGRGDLSARLEEMLATWRTSFRPEKAEEKVEAEPAKAPVKKPATRKPAAKTSASKPSAAKTTKSTAAKTSPAKAS